jgi:metal-responsive CopG/Arc/MetJ family transcriptional regulator
MKQIAIRFPEDTLDRIDAIIEERRGEGDRTAVIRELVAIGLEAREKDKAKR